MLKFSKNRLETFSDGVIAIIITIMVLNIPLPDAFGFLEIAGLLRSILIFFCKLLYRRLLLEQPSLHAGTNLRGLKYINLEKLAFFIFSRPYPYFYKMGHASLQ